jgi:hypothetical protein
MEKTKEIPVMVNDFVSRDLLLAAKQFVDEFKGGVYPILHRFKILDDEHIRKYLSSESRSDVFEDILRDKPELVRGLEQDALYEPERDVWGIFRDASSPVKSPLEDGFIFAEMPMANYSHRNIICKALSIRNKEILIDEDFLISRCVVKPTAKQEELWALLSEFCEKFNEGEYYKKWFVNNLFIQRNEGIRPNINILLGRYFISRKR